MKARCDRCGLTFKHRATQPPLTLDAKQLLGLEVDNEK